jgi:hypothetical protein
MKYVEPQITNVLKADSAIQGLDKQGDFADTAQMPTPNPAYAADE